MSTKFDRRNTFILRLIEKFSRPRRVLIEKKSIVFNANIFKSLTQKKAE